MKPPLFAGDARYRTVAQRRIVDYLLLYGWAREARHGDRAAAEREACMALDRWVGGGLPFVRAPDGRRYFDPAEVINFLKWAGAQHGDAFWEQRCIGNGRSLVRGFHSLPAGADAPPPPATLGPSRAVVSVEREFALRYFASGGRTVLRMALPLPDRALSDLAVECVAPRGGDMEFTISPGRADARVGAQDAPTIVLCARMSFTVRPGLPDSEPAPLSSAERELYTRAGEGIVRVSPQVAALAARLRGARRDAWTAVQAFWNFLIDELACGVVDYGRLEPSRPLDHVLESRWFDCQLGSALIVALCRAIGVPARMVGGYLVYPASPSHHWWAEAWLDDRGWVPLDTICADLSFRGRDAAWRDYFLGQVDYRMKTECLPRLFSRSPGLRLPGAWRMLARADGDVTEIGLYAADTGDLIYRDRIACAVSRA